MIDWNNDSIRALECGSIRSFMDRNRGYLRGRVLDYGAGKQAYRDLVDGEYVPYEKGEPLDRTANSFDCVMCNQVLQYVRLPDAVVEHFWRVLKPGGYLVCTYPTSWDEVEISDLWRFTKSGMERLLTEAEFTILVHERRAEIDMNGFKFPLGYGVVACKSQP